VHFDWVLVDEKDVGVLLTRRNVDAAGRREAVPNAVQRRQVGVAIGLVLAGGESGDAHATSA
jgi:hypothetical protein